MIFLFEDPLPANVAMETRNYEKVGGPSRDGPKIDP